MLLFVFLFFLQDNVWDSVIRCRPRPTLVELPLPATAGDSGSILQVIPGHVMVDRCSGSCRTPSYSCLPVSVENATLEVSSRPLQPRIIQYSIP